MFEYIPAEKDLEMIFFTFFFLNLPMSIIIIKINTNIQACPNVFQ